MTDQRDPLQELDEFETAVEARFLTHELAMAELARRLPPKEETHTTVFSVPVELVNGTTADQVRIAVATLPIGLRSSEVIDRLERDGLIRRIRKDRT